MNTFPQLSLDVLVRSITETYEDSDLGFLVFSKEKILLKSNIKAEYYLDKFAFFSGGSLLKSITFQENLAKVLEQDLSLSDLQEDLGLHFFFSPIRSSGQVLGVILQIVENSSSIASSAKLPKSTDLVNEHFLFLLNKLAAHVWLMNPTGLIFWQNETLRKYGNLKADKMMIGEWVNMIHPEDLQEANEGITAGLQSLTVNYAHFRMRNAEGEYNLFRTAVQPIFDENGQVQFWIGVNFNVENYREEISSFKEELRQKNKQLDLVEKKIFNSQKFDTIASLAGGVAHDFNNLLLVIGLSANLIEFNDKDKLHGKELNLIQNAIKNASKLANQLMTFSGKKPNQATLIDIKEEFNAIELLVHKTLTGEVKLNIDIAPNLWPITVDSSYLENSVLNMILNAKDALTGRDNAEIQVEISNYIHDESERTIGLNSGEYVCFKIADNGNGISKENLAKIFDPFFTTKEVGKGTGLGLSMVYGFVKQSEGEIIVESEEGKGTTFYIYLPKAKIKLDTELQKELDSALEKTYSHLKILVVEDDPLVRNSVVSILETKGFTCYTAFDAYAAYLYLKNGMEVDVILSDVLMPGNMNALDFYATVRNEGIKSPILFTSGYAENILVKDGKILDGYHLLMKPYSIDELISQINSIV